MPLSITKIQELINNDPHFVEFCKIHFDIRRTNKRIRDALALLREMKCSTDDLDKVYARWKTKENLSAQHIEEIYGVTWHCYDNVKRELNIELENHHRIMNAERKKRLIRESLCILETHYSDSSRPEAAAITKAIAYVDANFPPVEDKSLSPTLSKKTLDMLESVRQQILVQNFDDSDIYALEEVLRFAKKQEAK